MYAASRSDYRAAYLKNEIPFLFVKHEPSMIEKIFTIITLSYPELKRTELFRNITRETEERDKKVDTV